MSAPLSISPRRRTPLLALVAALTLVLAAGCSAPGLGRIQDRPPADLPPSLDLVTADGIGYTILDTDPASKHWRAIDAATGINAAERALTHLHAPLAAPDAPLDLDDIAAWIGPAAGQLAYVVPDDGDEPLPESTAYFADVDDRSALVEFLGEQGWARDSAADTDLAIELDVYTRSGGAGDAWTAIALRNDALLAARDLEGLEILVHAADRYAIPERRAMSDYTVDALKQSPMSVVFRSDAARTQLKRLVQADPAMREFARWLTAGKLLEALRDGWVGITPSSTDAVPALRVVASADWLAELAPRITLKRADAALLATLPLTVTHAIALHDPGAIAADWISSITLGRIQYATDADVKEGEQTVELLDVLGQLDGDAAIGVDAEQGVLHATLQGDDRRVNARDVDAVMQLAEVRGTAINAENSVILTVPLDERGATTSMFRSNDAAIARAAEQADAFDAAGRPPFDPVAWLWAEPSACHGQVAGWVAFDGTADMRASVDLDLAAGDACAGGSLLARIFPPVD